MDLIDHLNHRHFLISDLIERSRIHVQFMIRHRCSCFDLCIVGTCILFAFALYRYRHDQIQETGYFLDYSWIYRISNIVYYQPDTGRIIFI